MSDDLTQEQLGYFKNMADRLPAKPKSQSAEEAMQQNPILSRIVARGTSQTGKGIAKYGEAVNPSNLSLLEWIEHHQQETWDKIVYLECVAERVQEVTELLQSLRTEMHEDMNCMDLCNGEEWIGDIKKAIVLLQGI